MRELARSTYLLILVTVSAGCTSLLTSDVPPETVYWLAPPNPIPQSAPTTGSPSISVRIAAAPGLDADRLLIRGPGATLNSYAGARWADNIPEVLDTLIKTVLEDSGRFRRIASGGTGSRSDWVLDLELRAFFAVVALESESPTIEMEIRGYLECPNRELPIRIASKALASENTLTMIAAGFQKAVDASVMELLDQIPERCSP